MKANKETKKREQYEKNSFDYAGALPDTDGGRRTGKESCEGY